MLIISCPFRLVEEGGDWERRNRLKVYEGYHLLSIRDFKAGGELLLDALSTFTATELIDYNQFVTLTVVANTLSLSRTELKKKVSAQTSQALTMVFDLTFAYRLLIHQRSCKWSMRFPTLEYSRRRSTIASMPPFSEHLPI